MSKNKRLKTKTGKGQEAIANKQEGKSLHNLLFIFIIIIISIAIYSNTLSSPFVFDDIPSIVENYKIKDLSNFYDLSGTRYIGFLSFALNYHFGKLDVFGYHFVNILIHIINGFLVYYLVHLTFKTPAICRAPEHQSSRTPEEWFIAFTAALIFVSHPIQTQAVTYIVQRFTSLTTLFYLLAVVCYLKWRLTSSEIKLRYLWYGGALLSTIFSMKTKEISFTLPFMILLIEVIFFRHPIKRRWVYLIPFMLTLLIIPFSRIDAGVSGETEAGMETTKFSRLEYLFTQFRVIVTYLRLLVFPVNQNFDYDYPIYHSLIETSVVLSFLFLLSLFALSLYLILFSFRFHNRLIGFGILWFFLTLSIESSIIPIRDVINEHRLYLPATGWSLVISLSFFRFIEWIKKHERLGKKSFNTSICYFFIALVVFSLSIASHWRNRIWKDELSLWKDVVNKSPDKARGHYNLGNLYRNQGRLDEAIKEYLAAIRLKPDDFESHTNLGSIYVSQGQLDEALKEYLTVLKFNPDDVITHYNLAFVYHKKGLNEKAIEELETTLKLKPDYLLAKESLESLRRKGGDR